MNSKQNSNTTSNVGGCVVIILVCALFFFLIRGCDNNTETTCISTGTERVEGHYRTSKSGVKHYVKPHYRKKKH